MLVRSYVLSQCPRGPPPLVHSEGIQRPRISQGWNIPASVVCWGNAENAPPPGKLQLESPLLRAFGLGIPSLRVAPKLHILAPSLWGPWSSRTEGSELDGPLLRVPGVREHPLSGLPTATTLLSRERRQSFILCHQTEGHRNLGGVAARGALGWESKVGPPTPHPRPGAGAPGGQSLPQQWAGPFLAHYFLANISVALGLPLRTTPHPYS